jgi:hypothetical protein
MKELSDFVKSRVAKYYWKDDLNCATTSLNILSEHFGVGLHEQVRDAAVGMHGAGKYRAQCGLVEGALMFLGIIGRSRALADGAIENACREFAEAFEGRFGSLQCSVLRPGGFCQDDPPHLCEPLTRDAIEFSLDFVAQLPDGESDGG